MQAFAAVRDVKHQRRDDLIGGVVVEVAGHLLQRGDRVAAALQTRGQVTDLLLDELRRGRGGRNDGLLQADATGHDVGQAAGPGLDGFQAGDGLFLGTTGGEQPRYAGNGDADDHAGGGPTGQQPGQRAGNDRRHHLDLVGALFPAGASRPGPPAACLLVQRRWRPGWPGGPDDAEDADDCAGDGEHARQHGGEVERAHGRLARVSSWLLQAPWLCSHCWM